MPDSKSATILPMGEIKYQELLRQTGQDERNIDRAQCFEVHGSVIYFYNWRTETWWYWNASERRCEPLPASK